jgi:hypothetical protein
MNCKNWSVDEVSHMQVVIIWCKRGFQDRTQYWIDEMAAPSMVLFWFMKTLMAIRWNDTLLSSMEHMLGTSYMLQLVLLQMLKLVK